MSKKMNTVEELRLIESSIARLRRKFNRMDLDYTVQISVNSTRPKTVSYVAQITPPAEGLAPVTFISHESADELLTMIKAAIKNIDQDKFEIAYHEAQIVACKQTIQSHEERIEYIKNPPKEEENSTEENETKEQGETQ